MKRHILIALAAAIPSVASVASGQLIRVDPRPGGGVYVRAPFVRVETNGYGGSRVRAPFTDVLSPGYGYPGPVYPYGQPIPGNRLAPPPNQPAPGPTTSDLSVLDWQQLRQVLRSAAGSLDAELTGREGGDAWKLELQPLMIRDLVADDTNQPPDSTAANQLASLLSAFDNVPESSAASSVASLPSFQMVHVALIQLLEPPVERQGRLVTLSAQSLNQSLRRFTNGANWQRYLHLNELYSSTKQTTVAAPSDPDSVLVPEIESQEPEDDRTDLQKLNEHLDRFNRVAENPAYRVISQLPSFQKVQSNLSGLVALMSQASNIEELPPPNIDR